MVSGLRRGRSAVRVRWGSLIADEGSNTWQWFCYVRSFPLQLLCVAGAVCAATLALKAGRAEFIAFNPSLSTRPTACMKRHTVVSHLVPKREDRDDADLTMSGPTMVSVLDLHDSQRDQDIISERGIGVFCKGEERRARSLWCTWHIDLNVDLNYLCLSPHPIYPNIHVSNVDKPHAKESALSWLTLASRISQLERV